MEKPTNETELLARLGLTESYLANMEDDKARRMVLSAIARLQAEAAKLADEAFIFRLSWSEAAADKKEKKIRELLADLGALLKLVLR